MATSKHTAPYSAQFPGPRAPEGSPPPRWRVVGQDSIYFETPSQEEAWRYRAQLCRNGYRVRVERVPAAIAQNPPSHTFNHCGSGSARDGLARKMN